MRSRSTGAQPARFEAVRRRFKNTRNDIHAYALRPQTALNLLLSRGSAQKVRGEHPLRMGLLIHGPEPLPERHASAVKHRAGRRRGLVMTLPAFHESPGAAILGGYWFTSWAVAAITGSGSLARSRTAKGCADQLVARRAVWAGPRSACEAARHRGRCSR